MRPTVLFGLFSEIQTLKGIGPKWGKLLSKLCGNSVLSVLFHMPATVLYRPIKEDLSEIASGSLITTRVKVLEHKKPFSRKSPYRIICEGKNGFLDIVFFNYKKDYLIKQLPEGEERLISGQVEKFSGRLQMSHPDYVCSVGEEWKIPTLEPVYPLTQGVTNKLMQHAAREALKALPNLTEWHKEEKIGRSGWPSFSEALKIVHQPTHETDISPVSKARQRLAYDEQLANQLALVLMRQKMKKEAGIAFKGNNLLRQKLLDQLPFTLTDAQQRVTNEIIGDMQSPFRMLRLLQGDVGSGKTIVGLLAMLNAAESGYQAAMMAPTDILVRQHFQKIENLCRPLGVKVVLLTGRDKGKQRQETLKKIASGDAQIIIGTHALFSEDVSFSKLGFVLIDEQHRFGVEQRLALTKKAPKTDTLVMTATPIPRTLSLTYYGDMDISILGEKPPTRKPVTTRVLSVKKMPETIEALKTAIDEGRQVYWICPLIEETEKSDLANATTRFKYLDELFPGKVGLIHGKMKGPEKDSVMQDFIDKKYFILVATTVIEVGVDVKNASIMIIEQAERFGLSGLHQLRGRIGRGSEKASCVLLYDYPLSDTAKQRLNIMRTSEDGFFIAEQDLKLRGAGEVLGVRQSGWENFRLTDIASQENLVSEARQEAIEIVKSDPTLSSKRGEALKILLYLFEKETSIQTIHAG